MLDVHQGRQRFAGPSARARSTAPKSGFSLLEVLIVLAIMALATALILPRGAAMMDQVLAHAVFFDFQRQVSDLRREAFRAQSPLLVLDPGAAPPASLEVRTLLLRAGWSYHLDQPLRIGWGGVCSGGPATISNAGVTVMHLAAPDAGCRFIRLD